MQKGNGEASVGHWATKFWNRRKMAKSLGITVHESELTEHEMAVLEFCESTYSSMTRPRGGKR